MTQVVAQRGVIASIDAEASQQNETDEQPSQGLRGWRRATTTPTPPKQAVIATPPKVVENVSRWLRLLSGTLAARSTSARAPRTVTAMGDARANRRPLTFVAIGARPSAGCA